MVSGINNIEQSFFHPHSFQRQLSTVDTPASSTSFDIEDEAIISAQAKLLNELDKFNSGESSPIDLAIAGVEAKNTVSAEARVIQAKKDMFDTILDMVK